MNTSIKIDREALATIAQELLAETFEGVDESFINGRAHGIGSVQSALLRLPSSSATEPLPERGLRALIQVAVRCAWYYGQQAAGELTDQERFTRAAEYAANALRAWGLTEVNDDDMTGPAAWRHQLPDGRAFLDGRNSRVVESLQEALAHMDQFGGFLEPLFKMAGAGNTDTWKAEGARGSGPAPGGGAVSKGVETRMGASARGGGGLGHTSTRDYDAYAGACRARGVMPCSLESFQREYGTAPESDEAPPIASDSFQSEARTTKQEGA